MHYVSLLIEFLRGRPSLVFWTVALAQAVLWTLVPSLFYSAPPGDVALLLAVGREFVLGSYLGPPLAYWFGEIAFRALGIFGLYALAQACIVVALWGVFALGRSVVGTRHAVLGVLLMVGIAALTVPTPNFGPAVLAAPFWSLALYHYWRAVGDGHRGAWFLLGLDLGLLLLSSYAGVILVVLLMLFTVASGPGRRALLTVEPWAGLILFAIVIFPHAVWLVQMRDLVLAAFNETAVGATPLVIGLRYAAALLVTHLGVLLIVFLASGFPRRRRERAPEIDRNPVRMFARLYVYVFALAPAIVALAFIVATRRFGPLDRVTPLVVLSGLAVVIAAGDRIALYRERLVSSAWLGLLILPPAIIVFGLAVLPWTLKTDLAIAQPVNTQAAFFADTFQRRTGKPLDYVTGDQRLAPLMALAAPGRPHVYFAWAPERSPWVTPADLRANGAVLVWPAQDNSGTPPADLKSQFPEMVAEVPRSFAHTIHGFMPLIRTGWAVIRPPAQ